MIVREAQEADLPGVLAIYNDVIARSTAVFSDQPATLDDRHAWLAQRRAQGYPVLVAEDARGAAGFASFGDFRSWPGYRHTVEHSIHVRADARRAGVGRLLLEPLLARAAALGKPMIVAGIDGENAASLAFHARFGFVEAGRLREVGNKFGRWIDLVFLQRAL